MTSHLTRSRHRVDYVRGNILATRIELDQAVYMHFM